MNPILELVRLEEDPAGTFGVLKIQKQVFCVTLEPGDEENRSDISSIPVQQYICKRIESPRYGMTFEVADVPGRTAILFHAGNVRAHTRGCILLGESFGKLRGDRAVLNSGRTFESFMHTLGGYERLHLTIREVY